VRVAIEPVHRLLHRLRREAAGDRAAGLFAGNEAGIREHVEVLHDRGQRHRKRLRKLANRQAFALDQPGQQGAAGRIGKRREGAVQAGISILNHRV
jgi:hypothetical protein